FFFSSRRRHTRFSRDWSSDVCSSDLAPEQKVRFYDIENFTLSQTFNQLEQRNFEIERNLDQQSRTTVDYAFAFKPYTFEPLKSRSEERRVGKECSSRWSWKNKEEKMR